jgi:uncharacterized NAD(P)/FAD-binding protein YdhS
MSETTVAIIGAGFSGTLLSLWLQSSSPAGTRICLIDRGAFAIGRAYATQNRNHLLNVPVGRMSARPDVPGDFVGWLNKQHKAWLGNVVPSETEFVPRACYGAYLQSLLDAGLRNARAARLELLQDSAVWVEHRSDGVAIGLATGAVLNADIAVLATGNAPPVPLHPDIDALEAAGLWHGNPWAAASFAALDSCAPVLLIGTGLTMVDAAISLLDAGHSGPIHALSRHGLLPRRHATSQAAPVVLPTPLPNRLRSLVRMVRLEIAHALQAGQDWRPTIDALRPFTQDLWRALSPRDRNQFLRHLRAWWDVHRHRMPPVPADRIEAALASRQLRLHAGRIVNLGVADGQASVTFRQRQTGAVATVKAARVIDCTGSGTDITRSSDPLMKALLRAGMGRPDPLRLGLDVSATGALIDGQGWPSNTLFAVGPLTKGASWEITSVPDIRKQCRDMALNLGQLLAEKAERHEPAIRMPFRAQPLRSPELAHEGN